MWNIKKIISKGDYNYALVPEHPNCTKNGYVLEHRVVVENHIKRLLNTDEVVHHIDGNKKNNVFSNLEILTASNHAKLHLSIGRTYYKLCCPECGVIFEREKRKTKCTAMFCSRVCNGKFNRRKQLIGLTTKMKLAISANIIEVFIKPTDNTEQTEK